MNRQRRRKQQDWTTEKMASQRDQRIQIRVLLEVGKTPTEISRQLGISRLTVYNVRKKDDVERQEGCA